MMKRFILIVFGFLALAFYELSGGGAFDPDETRQASQEIRQELEVARNADIQAQMAALPPVTGRAPLAAPVGGPNERPDSELDLVSFSSVVAAERGPLPEISSEPAALDPALEEVPLLDETSEGEETIQTDIRLTAPAVIGLTDTPVPTSEDDETTGITFAGLSAATPSTPSQDVAPSQDVRVVSGTRVNMRAGPGTDFEVVDQLEQNTRVEVLENAGNGWVRLRPTGGGAMGWVAEFLLADG